MVGLVALMALIGLANPEFKDKVEEQVNKGYTWEYVGYTPWSQEKSPAILIEPHPDSDFPSYILFKLSKPKEVK
jgi:hypothetical protein